MSDVIREGCPTDAAAKRSGRRVATWQPEATEGNRTVQPRTLILTWLVMLVALATCGTEARSAPGDGDLLFTCDFESATWWEEWGLSERDPHTLTVASDAQRKFEAHRGKALRIRVDEGGHYGASLAYHFRERTGAEPDEIFFRYYLRFSDDWKPERGGKLPGLAGTYGRAGWGGRRVDGTDGWSARGLFQGQRDGRTPIGFYCYHADMPGRYGDEWVWREGDFPGLENNRWYCIEQHVRLNSPGKNDGILRGWVDGVPAFEKTDVRMRNVDALKIETAWLNLYYGGTWTATADYHLYIDDVAISRQPIGLTAAREKAAIEAIERLGGHVFRDVRSGQAVEIKLEGVAKLNDGALAQVAEFSALTDLSLERSPVSGEDLRPLANLNCLEWLNLWKSGIDDAGLAHLAGLHTLQQLPVGGTRITDDGLAHLGQLRQLAYLGLRDTAVTDAGVARLADMPALKELNLRGTMVTDAAIPMLGGMTSLEKVWLGGTAVTIAGIERLRAALPGCVIDAEP